MNGLNMTAESSVVQKLTHWVYHGSTWGDKMELNKGWFQLGNIMEMGILHGLVANQNDAYFSDFVRYVIAPDDDCLGNSKHYLG